MRLLINGREFTQKVKLSVNLNYDTVASSFTVVFRDDVDNDEIRQILMPLSFVKVEIFVGDFKILTGRVINQDYYTSERPEDVVARGYSLPGDLQYCEIPNEAYPLQDDDKTVAAIIRKIIAPFGLELHVNQVAQEDANRVIDKIVARQSDRCAQYIYKIASQYNLVVGHTRNGRLLLTKLRVNEDAQSNYRFGEGDYFKGSLSVDATRMHSRYTLKRQTTFDSASGDENAEQTVNNSIINIFRPTVKVQSVGKSDTTDSAVRSLRAGELGNIVFKIQVRGLNYQNGDPIRPNRIITVRDPNIYLMDDTKLFVRNVQLNTNIDSSFAVLDCVLPNALTGDELTNIFR